MKPQRAGGHGKTRPESAPASAKSKDQKATPPASKDAGGHGKTRPK